MCSVIRSLTASRANRKDSHQERAREAFCVSAALVCAGTSRLCLRALISRDTTHGRKLMNFIKALPSTFPAKDYFWSPSSVHYLAKYEERGKRRIPSRSVKNRAET